MLRVAVTLLLLLSAATASAQRVQNIPGQANTPASGYAPTPCPQTTSGWALQWSGPLSSASYDMGTQVLFLTFANGSIVQAFSNVPLGIMQALSYTQNPSAIYYGSIVPSYHQLLLTEKDHCTLRWEYQGLTEGFIWTD
jgi:hypothetical protein